RAGVIEKFGVPPERIVDYLALMGDSIDNIPGVPKCGPKTAAKWLNEYGSLDEVIARADEVKGKIGENLRAALPQLPLSRQLATIKTDVGLDEGPRDLKLRERDADTLRELYARYEFRQALKELEKPGIENGESGVAARGAQAKGSFAESPKSEETFAGDSVSSPGPRVPGPEPQYDLVTTRKQLDAWLAKLGNAELVAFDTETTSLDPMRAHLVGLSFSVKAGEACYIPVGHDYPGAPRQLDLDETLRALQPILEDSKHPKVGQHAKY